MIICSFSYREPVFGDIEIDARKLWNPHHDDNLRPLNGLHPHVQTKLLGLPSTVAFLEECVRRLEPIKNQPVLVTVGCVGGKHRSVFVADYLGKKLGVEVEHLALDGPAPDGVKPLKGQRKLPLKGGGE